MEKREIVVTKDHDEEGTFQRYIIFVNGSGLDSYEKEFVLRTEAEHYCLSKSMEWIKEGYVITYESEALFMLRYTKIIGKNGYFHLGLTTGAINRKEREIDILQAEIKNINDRLK